MAKVTMTEVIPEDLGEHRSVKAWSRLNPDRVVPDEITILKLKNKTAVYRLAGVGMDGAAVIAKRCRAETAGIERILHEEFLARMPVSRLFMYGFVDEPDGEYSWLFLEEAWGEPYSPLNGAHRALAGKWLASVHRAALGSGLHSRLPAHDQQYYLSRLQVARTSLLGLLAVPVLPEDDHPSLEMLVRYCDIIEAHWSELQERSALMPATLVHGDLVVKNVRVRRASMIPAFLVFDWEVCGWGTPATDFAQFTGDTVSPDLAEYWAAAEGSISGLTIDQVIRLAECGRVFRLIDDVHWASQTPPSDSYEFYIKPILELKEYCHRLCIALKEMGWDDDDFAPFQGIL